MKLYLCRDLSYRKECEDYIAEREGEEIKFKDGRKVKVSQI